MNVSSHYMQIDIIILPITDCDCGEKVKLSERNRNSGMRFISDSTLNSHNFSTWETVNEISQNLLE